MFGFRFFGEQLAILNNLVVRRLTNILFLLFNVVGIGVDVKAHYISWAVVGYLKDDINIYDIKTNSSTLEAGLFIDNTELGFVNISYAAEVVFQEVLATNIWRDLATHWWRYDFVFYCYWGPQWQPPDRVGLPLDDPIAKRQVQLDLNRSLRRALQLIANSFNLWERSNGVLGITLIDPTTVDNPFEDLVSTLAPVASPAPSSVAGSDDTATAMPTQRDKGGRVSNNTPGTSMGAWNTKVTFESHLDVRLWVSATKRVCVCD